MLLESNLDRLAEWLGEVTLDKSATDVIFDVFFEQIVDSIRFDITLPDWTLVILLRVGGVNEISTESLESGAIVSIFTSPRLFLKYD